MSDIEVQKENEMMEENKPPVKRGRGRPKGSGRKVVVDDKDRKTSGRKRNSIDRYVASDWGDNYHGAPRTAKKFGYKYVKGAGRPKKHRYVKMSERKDM